MPESHFWWFVQNHSVQSDAHYGVAQELVLRGDSSATFDAAGSKYRSAGPGSHTGAEAVFLRSPTYVRLEGTLGHENSLKFCMWLN